MMNEMENRINSKIEKNMDDAWEKYLIRQNKSLQKTFCLTAP